MKLSLLAKASCLFVSLTLVACATNSNLTSIDEANDRDRDGIVRALDRCPDTAPGVAVDLDGCPADSDGDGVFDSLDRCPGTAVDQVVDSSGCNSDRDGDGIFDWRDRCVDSATGQQVDLEGCEQPLLTETQTEQPVAEEEPRRRNLVVYFESDSARLLPEFQALLTDLLSGVDAARISRFDVVGHADSTGGALYNKTLSQSRAERVAAFLVSSQPNLSGRMALQGMGESEPVADNATKMGRLLNRRVEITLDIRGAGALAGR